MLCDITFCICLKSVFVHCTTRLIIFQRGPKANEFDVMFMEQADNIIETHFKDFGNFKASWLVKVTWENMTVNGMKKEEVSHQ